MKQQRGGTLLGLIIGALIGLGAALAVAVYITKVPVPFMNKSQPRSTDSDAAEAKKNKDWDPNAPLAGKNPVKPPAPSASGEVTNVTVPEPAVVGIEATGSMGWFVRLMEELGVTCRVGHPAAIPPSEVKR